MSKDLAAFPTQSWEYDGQNNVLQYQEPGMTLRDYFAAQALQGELASGDASHNRKCLAARAYAIADAMLEARSNGE